MSSLSDMIQCDRCGNPQAHAEYVFKFEHTCDVFCPLCGYSVHAIFNRETGDVTEEDEHKPLGAYSISFDGFGELGSYDKQEFIDDIKSQLKAGTFVNGRNEKPTSVRYTFFDGKEWKQHDLMTGEINTMTECSVS